MSVSLLGFSLLGLLAALVAVPLVSPVAIVYQVITVFILLVKGLCFRSETCDEYEIDDPMLS